MTRTLLRFNLLGSALLATLLSAGTQAAGYAGTQFEIEMVVFSRDNGMSASREDWPAAPKLEYDKRWVDFNTPSSGDPMVPALTPAQNLLDNKVAALRRKSGYTVLFHKTWRQVLQNERRAPSILINGGPRHGEHQALEGSVTVSVSHYLHLSTDLWFMEFDAPQPQGDLHVPMPGQTGILIPRRPQAEVARTADDEPLELGTGNTAGFGSETDSGYSTSADSALFHGAGATIAAHLPAYASRVAVLKEERRLRSGELHYIDHPKLGVLIEVRTVKEAPPTASGDAEALSL